MAKEITEHEYHVESKITITVDSYVVATNKKEAEEEAIIGIQEEHGGVEVDIVKVKIRERNIGVRVE
jgi:hypothetical protein